MIKKGIIKGLFAISIAIPSMNISNSNLIIESFSNAAFASGSESSIGSTKTVYATTNVGYYRDSNGKIL